jgi:hypothetical protein
MGLHGLSQGYLYLLLLHYCDIGSAGGGGGGGAGGSSSSLLFTFIISATIVIGKLGIRMKTLCKNAV